jgi:Tol biopolymer transport system component
VQVTAGNTVDVVFQMSCAAIGSIAFYSANQGLVSARADGYAAVPIPVTGYRPAWSPNGARIAFIPLTSTCAGSPSQSVVCVMNADGSGVAGLPVSTTVFPSGLSWSPDGTRIAFVGTGGLYAVNVDGSGSTQLTSGVTAGFPAWSPDGTKIAFGCVVDAGNNDICVANGDGTGLVRLTTDPADDHRPAWKPDGSRIAFVTSRYGSDANGDPGIAVMNADGAGVTAVGNGEAPAWSPDGGRIAFLYSTVSCDPDNGCGGDLSLLVMRADGSGRRFVGLAAYGDDTPAWKP